MAGEFAGTDPGLYVLITSVAKSLAVALNSQLESHYRSCTDASGSRLSNPNTERPVSRCFCGTGDKLRALKRNFATLHEEGHLIGQCLINSNEDGRWEIQRRLDEIALCLDSVIDSQYVGTFCPQDLIGDMHVKQLYHALQRRPTNFEDKRVICETIVDECSRFLPPLAWISRYVNDAASSDSDFWPMSSVPPVPLRLYHGSESVRDLAKRLHDSLHRGWPCQSEHDEGHEGRLGECTRANVRLDPKWLRHGAGDETFFVVLSVDNTTYQECRIHLDKPRFGKSGELLCLVDYEDSANYCLYLLIDTANRLWDDDDKRLDLQLLASDLPKHHRYELLTLREILPNLRMNYTTRRDLQLRLARTVLPLLAGPWMENCLAIYDISILCTVHEEQCYARLDNLFLSSRFGKSMGTTQRSRYGHPFPAIESLGILMAEIELSGHVREDIQATSSSKTAKMLLDQCRVTLPETGGVLQAISFCIDPKSFTSYRQRKGEVVLRDTEKFNALYYERVIRPLEKDLVDGCKWTWDEASGDSPKAIDETIKVSPNEVRGTQGSIAMQTRSTKRSTKRNVGLDKAAKRMMKDSIQGQVNVKSRGLDLGAVYDARGCVAGNDLVLKTQRWFDRLEDMRTILDRARKDIERSEVRRLVRVAVLDTGVDLEHSVFKQWRENGQLDVGLDLIDEESKMTDIDGHGTHVCHVFLKTAPNIKLYPVRVFRERQADASTPSLVAKGIQHAVQVWDVDIVSMSFAFDENQPEIEDAIREGSRNKSHKQVLFFAAASNNSSLKKNPIGFPGRMTDDVICVFSSSINGQPSIFSPKGRPDEPNFSVIGENIEAAWITSQNDKGPLYAMSGTSCATPIVAGIAALLLDFAKQYKKDLRSMARDSAEWEAAERYLQGRTGMKSVLRRCMTDEKHMNGAYHFLKPWQLLEYDFDRIATSIQNAIEEVLGTTRKS